MAGISQARLHKGHITANTYLKGYAKKELPAVSLKRLEACKKEGKNVRE